MFALALSSDLLIHKKEYSHPLCLSLSKFKISSVTCVKCQIDAQICIFFFRFFFSNFINLFRILQDCQTNRTLTLISKTIQSLGNLVSSRSAQQPCKEEYTSQLYKKFCTEKHIQAVKHFLEVVSTVGANPNENTLLEPVLLKEGWVFPKIYIFNWQTLFLDFH